MIQILFSCRYIDLITNGVTFWHQLKNRRRIGALIGKMRAFDIIITRSLHISELGNS